MEWFFGPKGLKDSPRSAAVRQGWEAGTSTPAATRSTIYREWAMAIVHGETGSVPSRYVMPARIVALRPDQDGRITGYTGAEEINQQYGEWVASTLTFRRRERRPSRSTPDTWPMHTCACVIPTHDALRGMLERGRADAARLRLVRVTLLGPQRRPTLDTAAASLRLAGPIATDHRRVAGARARRQRAGRATRLPRCQSLAVPAHGLDVQDRNPRLRRGRAAAAGGARRRCRRSTCCAWIMRLWRSTPSSTAAATDRLRAEALAEALACRPQARRAAHLHRISDVRGEFYQAWQPHDRPVMRRAPRRRRTPASAMPCPRCRRMDTWACWRTPCTCSMSRHRHARP